MAEVWINGCFVPEETPALLPSERGFLLGEAAFETMRIVDGVIRRWSRHAARLQDGLEFLGLPSPQLADVEAAALSLADRSGVVDGVVRLTVGGGALGGGVLRDSPAETTTLLTVKSRPEPPESVTLAVLDGARRGGLASERFKLAGYAENTAARRQARARGADMAVLRGRDGESPACADSATLFWIDADQRLFTPSLSTGALPGTTRAALLDAARTHYLVIEEIEVGAQSLRGAVAVCVANAVMGVVPASRIDGRTLLSDHPVLLRLQDVEAGAP